MPIEFHCAECGNLARTPDAMAGRTGRCPKCNAKVKIPESTEAGGIDEDDLLLGFQDGDGETQTTAPIEFICKGCNQLVRTPIQAAGKKGKCPHCHAVVRIPLQSTANKRNEKPAKPAASAASPPTSKPKPQRKQPAFREPPAKPQANTGTAASIEFDCQSCRKLVRTPASAAGKKGKCPHCGALMDIPRQSAAKNSGSPKAATPKTTTPKKQPAPSAGSSGVEFDCPSCSKQVRTPAGSEGKKGKCPHCGLVLKIPSRSGGAKQELKTRPQPPAKPAAKQPATTQPASSLAAQEIKFNCPSCQQQVATPPQTAGKKGRCPHCSAILQIPQPAGQKPATPKPAGQQVASPPAPAAGGSLSPLQGLSPSPATTTGGAVAGLTPLGNVGASGSNPAATNPAANGAPGLTPLNSPAPSGLTPLSGGSTSQSGGAQAGGQVGGLTPLGGPAPASTPANNPANNPTPTTPGLTPLGQNNQAASGGLTPLEPQAQASPAPASQGLTPLGPQGGAQQPASGGLTPIGGGNASSGLTPLAPAAGASGGLTPLGPTASSGLAGDGGLTPLGGGGEATPFDWSAAESSATPLAGGAYSSPSAATARQPSKPVSDQGRSGLPWEQRRGDGKFFGTVKMVLFHPSQAFSRMRCSGGLGSPLGFLCISLISVIVIYFAIFLGLFLLGSAVVGSSANAPNSSQLGQLMGSGIAGLVITATIAVLLGIPAIVIQTFILSGIVHVVLMMMGSARRSFEATFRVVSFTLGSVFLVYMIPCVSMFLAPIFYFIAMIIGIARAHEISGGKATIAVLTPSLIPALLFLWNLFTTMATIVSGAGAG